MPRYIELFEANRSIGRYDVPDRVHTTNQRFRLHRATKTGGNGVVFEACEETRNRDCAVKMLRQRSTIRSDRFSNEVRVLKELNSPYISAYYGAGHVAVTGQPGAREREVTIPWLAMQLGGLNMRQHIEGTGPLPLTQLKSVARGLCHAVNHVHSKGFIHRDIKPDNVVWRSVIGSDPMMIDFGLAKRGGEDVSGRPMDAFTQMTEFVGPVFYSSPELIEYARDKTHPVDFRSDIFQLGKVLWYLGTGKVSAGIPSRKECPAAGKLRDLILAMIDDDPDSRPQSLSDVRDRVDAI